MKAVPSRSGVEEGLAIPDAVAIGEVVRGNREMFEVLVRRYNQQLYRVGIACLKRHELAEDAMQNAYLKAYVNLRNFRGEAAFSTWLTRIMINECRMLRRKREASRADAPSEGVPENLPDESAAEHGLDQGEMKALLEHAVKELPENHRTVYLLREVQQLTTAETAACLGVSAESVKSRCTVRASG